MQRALPILVLVLLTVFAAGSAASLNFALGSMVAPSEADLADTRPAATVASGAGAANAAAGERPGAGRARIKSEREYLDAILGRNLFDPDAIASWNPAAAGGAGGGQAVTDLKIRLVGTMVAEPAVYSAAFIVHEGGDDGEARGYSIGHKIQDAEIVAIEKLKVTLRRGDGRTEVLTASDGETNAGGSAPSSPAGDGDSEGGVEKVSDNEYVVDRAVIDQYLGDLEGLSKMGRALLHRGPDGEFDGYRLSAIRRDTIADKLGIKNGDVIHSVNGQPLNSVQNAMGAYQTMQSSSEFEFEVTRRGEVQKLKYTIR